MQKVLLTFILALVFLLGFVVFMLISQKPGFLSYNLLGMAIGDPPSLSPSDYLDNEDILVYEDRIIIIINNSKIANYESDSMFPFLGENANGIIIVPDSPEQINAGDVITFRKENKLIVHRVIEKGIDGQGVYFITKGDNSDTIDGKIRFEEIEHILVGILY